MSSTSPNISKKKRVITCLFDHCKRVDNLEFDTDLVREISREIGFKNIYDVTKIDQSEKLPEEVRNAGYCIAGLGRGYYKFIKGLDVWYHRFEPIAENEVVPWPYKPSLLNHIDDSESNIISLVYNQRIIQHFLYEDITQSPKMYMSRRTKVTASYCVDEETINAEKLQAEIDATFEHNGEVTILEAKNGSPDDFSVYQLFHPFLVYHNMGIEGIKKIECCYLLRDKGKSIVSLYLYSFSDIKDMQSIRLIKKSTYNLAARNDESSS